jgi:hypothetical protein
MNAYIFRDSFFFETFWREVERLLPDARFWNAGVERVYISPRPVISSTRAYQTGGRLHLSPTRGSTSLLPGPLVAHLHLLARLCAFSTLRARDD